MRKYTMVDGATRGGRRTRGIHEWLLLRAHGKASRVSVDHGGGAIGRAFPVVRIDSYAQPHKYRGDL